MCPPVPAVPRQVPELVMPEGFLEDKASLV